jgi:hypothetical protein
MSNPRLVRGILKATLHERIGAASARIRGSEKERDATAVTDRKPFGLRLYTQPRGVAASACQVQRAEPFSAMTALSVAEVIRSTLRILGCGWSPLMYWAHQCKLSTPVSML